MAKLKVESYEEYDFNQLLLYAGLDCVVTSDLLMKLFPKVVSKPNYKYSESGKSRKGLAPSILWETQNVKMKAHEFILDLELNGFKYDIDENRRLDSRMRDELSNLTDGLRKHIPEDISLTSGTELRKFLYGTKGYEVLGRTKRGEPATDGAALKALAEKYQLDYLNDLRKYTDINSIHNSFISTYVSDWVKPDGRIHPQYNLIGTSSHRISSNDPNLLNLPNPTHGYNVRSCYTVDPGNVLLAFDFSSCEVKVLGALSKDPALLKAIEEGKDFHSYTACAIHGIDYDDYLAVLEDKSHKLHKRYKRWRQESKAVTFGILYGSSDFGIAAGLGVTIDEAKRLIAIYFDNYPYIKQYIEDSHNMATWNHWIHTPFGQRKMQFGTLPCFKYTAVYNAALRNAQNSRIQSTASTLGLMAFTKLNEEIQKIGGKAICTVYDSVEIEIPMSKAAEAVEIAFKCMDDWPVEEFDFLDLPIGTDGEVGFEWGNVEHIGRGTTQEKIEDILKEQDPIRYLEAVKLAA